MDRTQKQHKEKGKSYNLNMEAYGQDTKTTQGKDVD